MNFEEYQKETHKTNIVDQSVMLEYLSLGLTSEVGEVAGKVKKYLRGDYLSSENTHGDSEAYLHLVFDLRAELGDVFWYLSELATHLDLDLEQIAQYNITKLQSRNERNKIQGDGDNR